MKTIINRVMLAVLFVGYTSIVAAQPTRHDSVSIRIDNRAGVHLILYKPGNPGEQVEKDIRTMGGMLRDNKTLPALSSATINYVPGKYLTIDENSNTEKIILDNGENTAYNFSYQCNIQAQNYFLRILFSDTRELFSDSLISIIREVLDSTAAKRGRITFTYSYISRDGKLTFQPGKGNGQMDMLALKGGIGASLIKNKPVTDLTGEVGLWFVNRGYVRHQFYTSYNLYFFYDSGNDMRLNSMVNLGYRINMARNSETPNWLGVELGYLNSRKGELFDKNTFKLGFNWDLGKFISVSPQLFFTGDFKKAYPGLRIGFGF